MPCIGAIVREASGTQNLNVSGKGNSIWSGRLLQSKLGKKSILGSLSVRLDLKLAHRAEEGSVKAWSPSEAFRLRPSRENRESGCSGDWRKFKARDQSGR